MRSYKPARWIYPKSKHTKVILRLSPEITGRPFFWLIMLYIINLLGVDIFSSAAQYCMTNILVESRIVFQSQLSLSPKTVFFIVLYTEYPLVKWFYFLLSLLGQLCKWAG